MSTAGRNNRDRSSVHDRQGFDTFCRETPATTPRNYPAVGGRLLRFKRNEQLRVFFACRLHLQARVYERVQAA